MAVQTWKEYYESRYTAVTSDGDKAVTAGEYSGTARDYRDYLSRHVAVGNINRANAITYMLGIKSHKDYGRVAVRNKTARLSIDQMVNSSPHAFSSAEQGGTISVVAEKDTEGDKTVRSKKVVKTGDDGSLPEADGRAPPLPDGERTLAAADRCTGIMGRNLGYRDVCLCHDRWYPAGLAGEE